MPSSRNPKWTRDETILALDVYFKTHIPQFAPSNPYVIELSEVLNALPIHSLETRNEKFRNPTGVYMKLCNFLRCDPSYTNEGFTGLPNGSQLEFEVWEKYSTNQSYLSKVASAIKSNAAEFDSKTSLMSELDEDQEAPEGRLLLSVHRRRERNATLSKNKKRSALRKFGKLICEVCDFVFSEKYGEIGEGFIEAHHKMPLSELPPGIVKTKLSDLALVCSNCHRMLHKKGGRESVESLKTTVNPI
tara:strand:+ start:110 stop:847 length:738 start_codon:yes stop_codon:yes gene_type:complete